MSTVPPDIEFDSSVTLRSLSRSPRPYRRTQSPQAEPQPVGIRRWSMHETEAERWNGSDVPRLIPTPAPSTLSPPPPRGPQTVLWAFRNQGASFGSESGTEADDELPRKLPAPPRRTRSKASTAGEEGAEEEDFAEATGGTTGGDSRGERSKRKFRGS